MLMIITKPRDMIADLSKLKEAIEKFEKEFKTEEKGKSYYHLVIDGEYNRDVCDRIQVLYSTAGWRKVTCKTSSENGERPGLTGLQLYIS